MKGDFSRIRFNPKKQYTAVLEQQGRVSLDADANEQCAIDGYLRRTESVDVIGDYGAPAHDAGFAISVAGNSIVIGAGRYYVKGLMCENTQDNLAYGSQPYLLGPSPVDSTLLADAKNGGAVQVFLQVWQRLVTALDDTCLREPALGQADTTARLQTVWRVAANFVPALKAIPIPIRVLPDTISVAQRVGAIPQNLSQQDLVTKLQNPAALNISPTLASQIIAATGPASSSAPSAAASASTATATQSSAPTTTATATDCCTQMYAQTPTVSTGTMAAMTSPGTQDCSCQPIPAAGYQGLENQLYRVEIHHAGDSSVATFKWSRENGSVVAAILSISGPTVWVSSLGPDANLGFQPNDWVEISDDTYLFGQTPNQPGTLYQILSVDPTGPSITLTTPATSVDTTRNPRVRRWDQSGTSAVSNGVLLTPGSWQTLENGIQINFGTGTYQSGDYWTIPARSASGQIDWPPCGGNGNLFQSPTSVTVFNAPLACIHWDSTQNQWNIESCRRIFSPLTDLEPEITPAALHITNYSWLNDDITTFDALLSAGLNLTFDTIPTSPVSGANFIVTLEASSSAFSTNFDALGNTVFTTATITQAAPAAAPTTTAPATATAAPATTVATAARVAAVAPAVNLAAATAAPITASVAAPATPVAAPVAAPVTPVATPVAAPIAINPIAINPIAINPIITPIIPISFLPGSTFTPVYQVIPLNISILDWQITVNGSTKQVQWTLPATNLTGQQSVYLQLINTILGRLAQFGIYARARVKLLGRTIFAQSGTTQSYLDGQSFGQQATRQDGKTPCIALQMPSGSGDKGSDFEGWFYVAPFNSVISVTTNFPGYTVVVNQNNAVTSVSAPSAGAVITVTPQVTVNLHYPAVPAAGVTVSLSLSAVTAGVVASSFVSLASPTLTVVIPQGSSSATVNINVFRNPGMDATGKPVTDTFQISAYANLAYGSPEPQSTTFTLTGVQAPVPPPA